MKCYKILYKQDIHLKLWQNFIYKFGNTLQKKKLFSWRSSLFFYCSLLKQWHNAIFRYFNIQNMVLKLVLQGFIHLRFLDIEIWIYWILLFFIVLNLMTSQEINNGVNFSKNRSNWNFIWLSTFGQSFMSIAFVV